MQQLTKDRKTWIKIVTGLYILKLLQQGPAHGNKLAAGIKKRTRGTLAPNPNSLYPLLRSLEERGYVTGQWENPATRGKRIYTITEAGATLIPVLNQKVREIFAELERRINVLRDDILSINSEGDGHESGEKALE